MKTRPSFSRLISWLTIAALLTMLWSGTVSAVASDAASQTHWGEICSANAKRIDAGPSGGEHGKNSQHVHCAFCGKQNAMHVLPTRFNVALAIAAARVFSAINGKTTPIPSEAWITLPPRGPPAIS